MHFHFGNRNSSLAGRLIAALLLVTLTACGGGGGGSSSTTDTANTGGGNVTPTATSYRWSMADTTQPLSLGLSLDDSRAVTQTITASAGGVITATGADGTTYTLTIPVGALTNDLTVTMTPVAQFTSLPFHGSDPKSAWGVDLQPSGTTFLKALTLRITLPSGSEMPIKSQLPISWDSGGSNVTLAPLDPTSNSIDLQLMHFSGWAIARHDLGATASLSGLYDRLNAGVGGQLNTAMSHYLAIERQKALLGIDTDGDPTPAEFANFQADWERLVLQPAIAAGGNSCREFRFARQLLLSAAHQVAVLGDEETAAKYNSQVDALTMPGLNVCADEEYKKCQDNHIVQDIIPFAESIPVTLRYFGHPTPDQYTALVNKVNGYVNACLVFKLDVTSMSKLTNPGSLSYDAEVNGPITIRPTGSVFDGNLVLEGSGPLNSTTYSIQYNDGCTKVLSAIPGPSDFSVVNMGIRKAKDGSLGDFYLAYDFSGSGSLQTIKSCVKDSSPATISSPDWADSLRLPTATNDRFVEANVGYRAKDWVVHQGQANIAEWDDTGVVDGGAKAGVFTGTMTFKLTHTPGQ